MLKRAQTLSDELIRLRRDMHAHPELGFRETRTATLVAETLQEIGGITIRTGVGKTGVVADLGSGERPRIAIRADMDALPIQEASGAPYASTNPGVMHACGHDAHTAMLLGVARLLRDTLADAGQAGSVRLLFQPSEETSDAEGVAGAQRMMDDGALDGVDAVIALHIQSTHPSGEVSVRSGWLTAAVDTFDGWITAKGGHGAYPHEGGDPLWMLMPVLNALYGIVSRRVDPVKSAVVSLGQVHAGTISNVLPAEVYLQGTLRSFDPQVREQLLAEVERALAISRALGGDYRLQVERGCPAGWNAPQVIGWLERTAIDLLGEQAIDRERAGMGGEDFAYMCQRVPGAMFMLGAALPDGVARPHHTPIFDIDEQALPIGAAILAETAVRFLRGQYALDALDTGRGAV